MCGLLHLFHPDRSVLVDWSLNTEQRNRIWFHPDNYVHPGWLSIRHWARKHWRPVLGATACHFVRADLTYKYILLNSAILLKKYLSFVLDCIIMAYIFFAFPVRVRGVYWNHHVTVCLSVCLFVCLSVCLPVCSGLLLTVPSEPGNLLKPNLFLCACIIVHGTVCVCCRHVIVCVCFRHTVSVADMSLFVSVTDMSLFVIVCVCLSLFVSVTDMSLFVCVLQTCHYLCLLQTLKWRVQNTRV